MHLPALVLALCFVFTSLPPSLAQSSASTSPAITSPPSTTTTYSPGQLACLSEGEYISICNSLTPGFVSLTDFSLQAPCLCYSSTSWAPSIYDGYHSSCLNWYSTADPSDYFSITAEGTAPPVTAPCQKVGDVVAAFSSYEATVSQNATTSPSTTTSVATTTSATTSPTATTSASTSGTATASTTTAKTNDGDMVQVCRIKPSMKHFMERRS